MKSSRDNVLQLPLNRLKSFPDFPFRVGDDEGMQQLVESIRTVGVLTPITVRSIDGWTWQVISGHRRIYACGILGKEVIPAIVKDIDHDGATIMMVDSNCQRESLLPSEKAKAYKMKLEAIKRQGARHDLTSAHLGQKLARKTSRDAIASNCPDSSSQIQRYIRLNDLVSELLAFVDQKRLALTPAVELSYLSEDEQRMVVLTMESEQASPSLSQAQRMRELSTIGLLSDDMILSILSEKKKDDCWNLVLPMKQVSKYFPKSYTQQQMQDMILKLLERWQTVQRKRAAGNGESTHS